MVPESVTEDVVLFDITLINRQIIGLYIFNSKELLALWGIR